MATRTAYAHRHFIIIAIAKATEASRDAKAWDPDTGGDRTFSNVRLSATGVEPATHYGANTASTAAMRTGVLASRDGSVIYALYREADGWTWEKALRASGLKLIVKDAEMR
jgi:hypothetical protein